MNPPNQSEDNEILCRQLLRIVAQIRSGSHVEASTVAVNRGGSLTIYTVSVSLEDPPPPIFARSPDHGRFVDRTYPDGSVVTFPAGGEESPTLMEQLKRDQEGNRP